jgi:hypothetical protein
MCKRHVQEIREHEGETRKCARDTCRRSGNMKERQNMCKRQCTGEQEKFRRDEACARDNVKVTREH